MSMKTRVLPACLIILVIVAGVAILPLAVMATSSGPMSVQYFDDRPVPCGPDRAWVPGYYDRFGDWFPGHCRMLQWFPGHYDRFGDWIPGRWR